MPNAAGIGGQFGQRHGINGNLTRTVKTTPLIDMPAKNVMAVDPGVSGGFAVSLNGVVHCWPTSKNEDQTVKQLTNVFAAYPPADWVCFMEQVGGYIGEEQPGSRMFTFGNSFGSVRGMIKMAGVSVRLVRPQVWQRDIPNRGGEYRERKRALKAWAKKHYPEQKVTDATADALCILRWSLKYGLSDTLLEKQTAAEAWCLDQGHDVPAYDSREYKLMFAEWCKFAKIVEPKK